jgi:hypothetical protein
VGNAQLGITDGDEPVARLLPPINDICHEIATMAFIRTSLYRMILALSQSFEVSRDNIS